VQQSGSSLHHGDLSLLSFQIDHTHAAQVILASNLTQLADALNDVPDSAERLTNVFESLPKGFGGSTRIG
jgi:hypothetical protein